MTENMIELREVSVDFGGFSALKSIDLDVKKGEFFTLLGPSGCGKTTTLRSITGFVTPTRGSIHVDGKDVTRVSVEERNIGLVFQSYALFPSMNVFENIAFGLKLKKFSKSEIHQKVIEIGEKVGLTDTQLQKKVNELSGGQQQRVAIARALVISPAIICLDEPLSNLDAKLRVKLRNELKDLQKKFGITTIYVTHDQEEALTLSDRIAVFNDGCIEQIGTPEEVYKQSKTEFVCNFLGDINELDQNFLKQIGFESDKKCYIRLENIYVNSTETRRVKFGKATVIDREYHGLYVKYSLDAGSTRIRIVEKASSSSLYEIGQVVEISLDTKNILQY